MRVIEDQGTSTLPQRVARSPAMPMTSAGVIMAMAIGTSMRPGDADEAMHRSSLLVEAGVDPDFSFSMNRIRHHRSYAIETVGSDDASASIGRDRDAQQRRRVELLERRRHGTLADAERRELDSLQEAEAARLEAELRPGTDRLERLLDARRG